jgi:hypothetical protein
VSSATQERTRAGVIAEDVREIAAQTTESGNSARAALSAAVGNGGRAPATGNGGRAPPKARV